MRILSKNKNEASEDQDSDQAKPDDASTISNLTALPEHWEDQQQNCELKSVCKGTVEWQRIEEQMEKGPEFDIEIIAIDRIQNKKLWHEYKQCESEQKKEEITERELFHGTRDKNPAEVCEHGFGDFTKEKLGNRQGVYFAVTAKYADKYAYVTEEHNIIRRQVFLAKVLIAGKPYTLPVAENETIKSYSKSETFSVIKNEGKVYGIFESNWSYPAYLITYIIWCYKPVDAPEPFKSNEIDGCWIVHLENKELTKLWYQLKDITENLQQNYGIIRMECLFSMEKSKFRIYTSLEHKKRVGENLKKITKSNIDYHTEVQGRGPKGMQD